MSKEYGKLNPDQFQRIVKALPEIRGHMKELPELVAPEREYSEWMLPDLPL